MENNNLYYIWLSCLFYPGSSVPKTVLEHFGSIEAVYNADEDAFKALGLSKGDIFSLCNKNLDNAKRFLDYCLKNRIGILGFFDPYYPERLKIISNPPPMFYYVGKLNLLDDHPCMAMVGTRSCSESGFRHAYKTAYDAASKGAVIINGLALGIDGACIAGALDANGYAVGLLGCGIDRIYPEGNKELFKRLSASGLILTEFAPFTKPEGRNFPVRNRVISGLSVAVVIFESAEKSGALITAKHALEQGRRIFAVPGKPYDKNYAGPLELIKDGATVFTEADDVLTEYSMSFPHRINLANINEIPNDKLDKLVSMYFKKDVHPDTPVNRRHVFSNDKKVQKEAIQKAPVNAFAKQQSNKNEKAVEKTVKPVAKQPENTAKENSSKDTSFLSRMEKEIYDILCKNETMTPDEIADSGVKIDDILSALTLLEIYGFVKALPGGKYSIIK